MAEALPSVALLFDDAGLGSHLRQALQEHGAHIVHEGAVAGFDAALLRQFDPDVLAAYGHSAPIDLEAERAALLANKDSPLPEAEPALVALQHPGWSLRDGDFSVEVYP